MLIIKINYGRTEQNRHDATVDNVLFCETLFDFYSVGTDSLVVNVNVY